MLNHGHSLLGRMKIMESFL